jgi:hypothetical protein
MPDPRTIFLATDGRYVTAGRGDVALSDVTLDGIKQQGLRGWSAILSDSMFARKAPTVTMVDAIGGEPGEWAGAVAALMAGRKR